MSESRRIGRFRVNGRALRDDHLMRVVQSGMAVLRIEHELISNQVSIWGVGDMFDPLPHGFVVPEYRCEITNAVDGPRCAFFRMSGGPDDQASRHTRAECPDSQ